MTQSPIVSRDLPIARLIPNVLTMMSLSCGLTAIRFALDGTLDKALLAVLVAGIFDLLDGRIARLLRSSSRFGAELDSLSDIVSFGVVPPLVVYVWILKDAGAIGWVAVLAWSVCAALRLARFNTMSDDDHAPLWMKRWFMGVPVPAAASLCLLPVALTLESGVAWHPVSWGVAAWMIAIALLMVSRLPTFALKGRRIPRLWVTPAIAGVCLLAAAILTEPWVTLPILVILYFLTLPIGFVVLWKNRQNHMRNNLDNL